jgi:hypothetical protein
VIALKRLFKRKFTYIEKQFLVTVDTDGCRLFLKCYEGSSEKNTELPVEGDLKEKVYEQIAKHESTTLASNAVYSPNNVTPETYKYYHLEPDADSTVVAFLNEILEKGIIKLEEENQELENNLFSKQIKFTKLKYYDDVVYLSSLEALNELQEEVMSEVRKRLAEIEYLKSVDLELSYAGRELRS